MTTVYQHICHKFFFLDFILNSEKGAKAEGKKVVDVDRSYLQCKQHLALATGSEPVQTPLPPLAGWECVDIVSANVKSIPKVTHGKIH